uniref:transglycosylase domain-containing protein n=1 Tax=Allorhizocola rhizosphaerae TaxID=1872709 RepID=UPI0013C2F735
TITQQYARQAANDLEVTYARKVREAIMARKLEDTYTKEEILGFYLNTVYFGRGAHGIGAAAEAYFGIKPEEIKEKLGISQAALLGAVLKQPEGKNGFDPHVSEQARQNSESRWNYVLNNMVENGWLSADERAKQKYPWPQNPDAPAQGELIKPAANQGGATGYTDSGTGFVINYIEDELAEKGVIQHLKDQGVSNWKNAGLKITTTIDPAVQAAMEAQLNREGNPSATLAKERENIIGAGVAIDPRNGRVLAYYGGGNNGSGTDFAGEDSPHPPASSFKIYTLAAAIDKNISIKSHWDPTALKKSAGDDYDLGNANREGDGTCGQYCTLEDMTVSSFNVPFFDIARKIQPKAIIEMAHKAGVRSMWSTDPFKEYDLSKGIPDRNVFDYWTGIGQYPVTVLDHASGTATFANHGIYNKPHFVLQVEKKNKKTGAWERISQGDEQLKPEQRIRPEVADEVTSVLKKIPTGQYALSGGYEGAGKTGTWENGLKSSPTKYVFPNTNAHVWFTGYTTSIAATFWVGSKDENKTPIKMNTGKSDLMRESNMASNYPKGLWKKFMDQVNKDLKPPKEKLSNGSGGRIGDDADGVGTGISPTPQAPSCTFPQLCPSNGNGGGGGGGGGGGNPNPTVTPSRSGRPNG